MILSEMFKFNKTNLKKTLSLNLLLITFISSNLTACKSKEAKVSASASVAPVLTVAVYKPQQKVVKQTLEVTGSLAAWDLLSVQPSVNGLKVMSIYTDAGQNVTKGQILVKLDDSILKAQLAASQASLENAKAQLSKARNPNRQEDILRERAAVTQAKANLDNARDNAERYDTLYKQGAVSRIERDTRQTTFETSQALYNQEVQRLNLLMAGSRSEDIRIAEAAVSSVNAQIQQINVQLAQTEVKAPDSGLVSERMVHLGDVSSAATKMFSIIRNNRFELQAKAPETDLRFIKVGDTVSISSDANPNLKTSGKVRQIGPGIDPTTRQGIVKIDVAYVPGMQTGQFIKGNIVVGSAKRIIVPTKSVINTEGNPQVFVVVDSIAHSKKIVTGVTQGNMVEVKSGLSLNDQIISDGAGFIKEGDKVKVVYNNK